MEEETLRAKKKAMALLQHMDRTEWELRSRLQKSGFSEEAEEVALEYVKSFHYVDDQRYAVRFAEIYHESRSIQRIRQDLLKRHISEEYIDLALEEIDHDDSQALKKALQKVLRGQMELSYEERQKVMAKLYRKGFRPGDIQKQLDLLEQRSEEI